MENNKSVVIEGCIVHIGETQNISKVFKKREFILSETHGKFPNTYKFELRNKDVDGIDVYAIGECIKVKAYVNGREWKNAKGETVVFLSLVVDEMESHVYDRLEGEVPPF